ncbi:WSC-domain-containing protein [Calocera viscosa TUFC12733]|uniref:WSC-domain-containing protein n=1 Tax=Calocera viscosa (strain TUFC12733) TaxID=1330018 RepID=A0A167MTJ9_CALVF|nr:WSC-domain-containing protein [Calocera viscosa TUFC12733]
MSSSGSSTEVPTSTAPTGTSSASSSSTSSGALPSYTPLGCYSEPTPYSPDESRAIPNATTGALTDQTVEGCVDYCYNLGYPLAAVEHGNLCFCSDGIYYGGAPVPNGNSAGECATPCSGDSSEICGGHYLFDLYANPTFLDEFYARFPMARFHAEKRKIGRYARRIFRYLE